MICNKNKRIVVLDRHPIFAQAISSVVDDISIEFKSEYFVKYESALEYAISEAVDLIILDVELDLGSGFSFLRRAKLLGYKGKFLFFTALDHQSNLLVANKLRADGFCSKNIEPRHFKNKIIQVINSNSAVCEMNVTASDCIKLTQREELVLAYLYEGVTNKKISEELHLSPKTISTYKSRILRKYGVSNIMDLMKIKGSHLYG